MAIEKQIKTKISLRYLEYATWSAESFQTEKPLKGEVWFCEVPTGNTNATTAPTMLFKVGDGVNTFGALKWASALAADVYAWAKQANLLVERAAEKNEDGSDKAAGNVISGIYWENDRIKYTTASVATSEGMAALQETVAGITKDIADNRDVWAKDDNDNTTYQFSIPAEGDDKGKLLVEKKEIGESTWTKVDAYDFVTPDELNLILADYYTKLDLEGKIHTEEEIKAMEIAHATAAGKVDKALTVKVGSADVVFDGSEAKTVDVDSAIAAAINAIPDVVHPEYSIIKDATSEYAATYHLTKDGVNVGAAINIPKDLVVESGTVETLEAGQPWGNAGTYIILTLANATNDKLYIDVGTLIEYVTSGSAIGDMVYIDVSNDHKVTATITDGTITEAKLHIDVTAKLNKDDNTTYSFINKTGTDLTFTVTPSEGDAYDVTLEANGKADKVTGAVAGNFASLDANGNLVDSGKKADDFDAAGAAATAKEEAIAAAAKDASDKAAVVLGETQKYADEKVATLAGEGNTTTVKAVADRIQELEDANHISDVEADTGLKVVAGTNGANNKVAIDETVVFVLDCNW